MTPAGPTPDSVPLADMTNRIRRILSPPIFGGMLGSMALGAIAIHKFSGRRDLAWRFAKARARDLAGLLGVRVHVRGLERLADDGPFVFTPNHQSILDVLVLLGHLPGTPRFVAKHELWRYPILGGVLETLGMIAIDREHPDRAVAALRAAGTDQSLVIFPEGTRSRDGRLLPFKTGAFALAIEAALPIVPVVCRGTRALMPPQGWGVTPGEVEIVLETPIPTRALGPDDRQRLAERVRAAILRHHSGD
jgi:1-acyl-sn-glycerol-3-phosphate acyltransferase